MVAANKVDRPGGPEAVAKLSQQLLEEQVVLEAYGGEVRGEMGRDGEILGEMEAYGGEVPLMP